MEELKRLENETIGVLLCSTGDYTGLRKSQMCTHSVTHMAYHSTYVVSVESNCI